MDSDRDTNRDESEGQEGSEALGDLLNVWWSRYCPTCRSQYPIDKTVCPEDGTGLRDHSLSFDSCLGTTGYPASTSEFFQTGTQPRSGNGSGGEEGRDSTGRSALSLPETLGGKWRILARQGGGTFGTFFTGQHLILGMRVGIKVLRRRLTTTSTWRHLFHEEAMRVSCLSHPNIVKVLDYGEEADRPYLVMEYLTGKPLHHSMGSKEFRLEDGVEVIRQTAIALIAAHQGVGTGEPLVHLDLKPEHIFLEKIQEKWHVKVIDFGIAEISSAPSSPDVDAASAESSKGTHAAEKRVAGTLPYMAPERWEGVVDPRCDIYSLGIILYELVAGRKPFVAQDPKVMRGLHETEAPTPPSHHRSGVRTAALKELDSITLWCLEKDPGKRPQSAQEMVKALEKWQARPRLTRGQRVARALAIPGLVLLAALGVLYWAPWEELIHNLPIENVIGPKKPLELRPVASGPGYKGGQVHFLLSLKGEEQSILLGRDPNGTLLLRFEDVLRAFPDCPDFIECQARLWIRGWLGRSVSSDSFQVVLDSKPPALAENGIGGDAQITGEGDQKILWLFGVTLTVTVDNEVLRWENCWLNGTIPAMQVPSDPKTVKFKVPPGEERLSVTLQDLAENSQEYTWGAVRWVILPVVEESHRKFSTNLQEFTVPIPVNGSCGKILVDGNEPRLVSTDGKRSVYEMDLSFNQPLGVKELRHLNVKMWSECSVEKKKSNPDTEVSIEISNLSRELSVVPTPLTGRDLPDALQVVDMNAQNQEVPSDEPLRWTVKLSAWDGQKRTDIPVEISRSGQLQVNGRESLRGRGKLTLSVQAIDKFGNESNIWEQEFGSYASPPKITDFKLLKSVGTEKQPLLHQSCPLRDGNPSVLELGASIQYQFEELLVLDLFVNDPKSPEKALPVQISRGDRLVFPMEQLFGLLQPGRRNELFLVATDKKYKELTAWAQVIVHYDDSLRVKILPVDASPLTKDKVEVSVTVSGPRLKKVMIKDLEVKPSEHLDGRRGDVYKAEVEVELHGMTTVEVVLEFENGLRHAERRSYCREPVKGEIYRFPVGKEGWGLDLMFHRDDVADQGSYFTHPEAWKRFSDRFRASPQGTRYRGSSSQDGVTREEAQTIAKWLTDELKVADLLRPNQEARLPRFVELQSIMEPGEEGVEWVLDLPENPNERMDAAIAVKERSGKPKKEGANRREFYPFRFILPAGEEGKFLNPRQASSAKSTEIRAKEPWKSTS